MKHVKTTRNLATLRQGRNDWYKIVNRADVADVMIYDEIGYFGVTASDFVNELRGITAKKIDLHISSPGGEIFDGVAIYNALRQHDAYVHVTVDSLAASAASFIAMSGDRITMARNSQMMIHDGHGMAIGNASDMRELADLLDRQSDNIASIYAQRAGGTVEDWREKMRKETWYTADEAVEAGLADDVEGDATDASFDLSIYANWKPAQVTDAACPSHSTAIKEGDWDASMEQGKMASPMPVATAKKMYAMYDADAVEDGKMPKSAGHLPHHFVDENGNPGAASMSGVRAALARLNQVKGATDAEKAAAERHLRGHLEAGQSDNKTNGFEWNPETFRQAIKEAINA